MTVSPPAVAHALPLNIAHRPKKKLRVAHLFFTLTSWPNVNPSLAPLRSYVQFSSVQFLVGSGPVYAREACFGPCVVAAAYAAVVDTARYTGMRWLVCTCRRVLGGDRGLLWAPPDYNFLSGCSLFGYRPVAQL